jgi:hypothetical protein
MISAIFSAIFAIIIGIVRGIIYLAMLIFKFLAVLIKIVFTFLGKIIASLFKIILSGLGKVFTFLGKGIISAWKVVVSLFSKSGIIASSAIKAPLVTKAIATTATGVAVSVGSGTVQTVKTIAPAISKTSVGITKNAVKTTRTIVSSSGKTIRRISNIEKNLIKNAKYTNVFGKSVAKRNSTFNPKAKDALGRTNINRMKQGLAPIGKDGKSIELHHLKQQNNGIIVELTSTEHKVNSKILHRYTRKSEINRQDFNKWKKQYWKERAKDFE